MTPCEKRGWKEGDKFTYIGNHNPLDDRFVKGAILILDTDDGTDLPKFRTADGSPHLPGEDDSWYYCELFEVSPLVETLTVSKNFSIAVVGDIF